MSLDQFLMQLEAEPIKSIDAAINKFVRLFPYLFAETDQSQKLRVVSDLVSIGVPKQRFKEVLSKILSLANPNHADAAVFFRAVHYAYDFCLGRDISEMKIIVWQKHSPFTKEDSKFWLVNNVRNIRFLIPVRKPEVALSSHFDQKNYHADEKSQLKDAGHLLTQLTVACRIHPLLESRSKAVRFEDMHVRTSELTKSMAVWIGIDWDPVMLEPTVDGHAQLFPKDGKIISGLNKDIEKQQSARHFSFVDRLVFQSLNRVACEKWGYDTIVRSVPIHRIIALIGPYIPTRMEMKTFMIDWQEKGEWTAVKNALSRRKRMIIAMRHLNYLNSSKTSYKIISLLG